MSCSPSSRATGAPPCASRASRSSEQSLNEQLTKVLDQLVEGYFLLKNEFCCVYFLKFDGDVSKLNLQEEEVAKLKFMPVDELGADLKVHQESYAKHGEYWNEVIEKLREIS